ncbi:MAG: hypothetical protein J5722_09150, partial [Oscillospiraceae bacterium]|nr:hypothetical protein [Oscillospiraceae bacterium]
HWGSYGRGALKLGFGDGVPNSDPPEAPFPQTAAAVLPSGFAPVFSFGIFSPLPIANFGIIWYNKANNDRNRNERKKDHA